jgi:choline dehydrogenase
MRSGIGPADHLREVGVPVVADLTGVGSNLADHPTVWLEPGYLRPGVSRPPLHTLATFRSSHCGQDEPPDLALWIPDPTGDPGEASIEVLLMTPASRGTVRLASSSPTAAPLIQLPQLDAEGDYDRLSEGLLRAKEIAEHAAVRALCEGPSTDLSSSDEIRAWMKQERYSLPHTVGTCAMGSEPGSGSVVDPHGKVHGIERLAVADASIIPIPPAGFPHVITIMIAERFAGELAHDLEAMPP